MPIRKKTVGEAVAKLKLTKSKRQDMIDVIQVVYPGFDPMIQMIENELRAAEMGDLELKQSIDK